MLPRSVRLRKTHEFEQVYQQGRRVSMEGFTVYALQRKDASHSRVGFVTGRRLGTHGVRNRAKRRLRAVVRALWEYLPPHHDLVFVARQPVLRMSHEMLMMQVRQALQKLSAGDSV
ncbi:MAG: ribonuclease P protein component [Armatimonadota bacterium]